MFESVRARLTAWYVSLLAAILVAVIALIYILLARALYARIDDSLEAVAQVAATSLANDLNEVAGRTGMGAVMGSKRLKAIAVRGKLPVKVADQKGLTATAKWVSSTMDQNHRAFHEFGTGAAMQGKSLEGGMPTLNYRLGAFEETAKVDAIAVRDQMRVEMKACYACSVRCKKVVHIEEKEERAREHPMRQIDPKDHVYDGAAARRLPDKRR